MQPDQLVLRRKPFSKSPENDDDNNNDTNRTLLLTHRQLTCLSEIDRLPDLGTTAMFEDIFALPPLISPSSTGLACRRLPLPSTIPPYPRPLTKSPPRSTFRFFDLPAEVRNIIYEYCLIGERTTPEVQTQSLPNAIEIFIPTLTGRGFGIPCPQLLAIHPLANHEAKNLLYLTKTFLFTLSHSMSCVMGTCKLRGCQQRCIKVDWSINEGRSWKKGGLPSWTGRIYSAHIQVIIDPISERLVSRGNILAALNNFLHIFSLKARKLETLQVRFVVKGRSLCCPHLYSVLFPLTRCPNLKKIVLVDVPGQEKIQEKLQRQLGGKIPCLDVERVERARRKIEEAEQLLTRAKELSVGWTSRQNLARRLQRPQYQCRTKCDLTWYPCQGAVAWPVPRKAPSEGREIVAVRQKMVPLCKGRKFYRRLEKANLRQLEEDMESLRTAIRNREDDVWGDEAIDSGVDV